MKCKDFFILKLRYYADAKLLKKWRGNSTESLPQQHRDRAKLYNDFLGKFIEKVTGENYSYWVKKYFLSTRECMEEQMEETHGIHVSNNEEWITIWIPKQHTEIISWTIDSMVKELPYKIVSKTRMGWWMIDRADRDLTWKRKLAIENLTKSGFYDKINK